MKFDILGRIANMRLPDGKAALLYSVYEAVSNSVHAIEARFGDKSAEVGSIAVDVVTDEDGYVQSIAVTDNGTGFLAANREAFDTSDSRFKAALGGKGVGRLIWIKLFRSIRVFSSFQEDGRPEKISFEFDPTKEKSIVLTQESSPYLVDHGSTVVLSNIRHEYREKVRKISFLRDLALHFFSYYMAGTMPTLVVSHNGTPESLAEFIAGRIDEPIEVPLEVVLDGDVVNLTMSHMYVDPTISTELKNSILFTAHHRLVGDPVEIERKFALSELPAGKAYVGLVKGPFLDDRVDQERIAFKMTADDYKGVVDAAIGSAEVFLTEHIREMRSKQARTVALLVEEHPQLAAKVGTLENYVEHLSPGMDEEQIGENLFTLLYRDERKISKKIREFSEIANMDSVAREEAEKVLSQVTDQAKNRLAELVVKRKQVLELAASFLRFRDDTESYEYETTVHDLICPLGDMYGNKDYSKHNLWIVDELLAYYEFFASDKQIRVLSKEAEHKQEPDLIFFNPLGFRREGTNDPVVLVEFKRPGDERPSKDPVDQVLDYIERLRSKTVRDVDGNVVSEIREGTPFECYVVCDLTEGTRRILARSLAPHETPDGEGYYGYAPNHRATIHVISFKKMLRDAEMRNRVFFTKLGLVTARP